jgi:hypothetical protein
MAGRMRGLSSSRTETKTVPETRHDGRHCAELALGEGEREGAVEAHDLAGGLHLWAQQDVDAGEAGEGEHRLLDARCGRARIDLGLQ